MVKRHGKLCPLRRHEMSIHFPGKRVDPFIERLFHGANEHSGANKCSHHLQDSYEHSDRVPIHALDDARPIFPVSHAQSLPSMVDSFTLTAVVIFEVHVYCFAAA